ncbi:MAG: Smr/MutS family protein [Candidatus Thiocaldithrix dubininis]|jgi:DNA-nicking Smr family endonuclease|uniref:Smr/MutS family protein n=1 Tax=Candidatus Thiocaldithrix dubininis TaxID=3080823 RepID=A0AA95HB36_9GAMM|nr:MAG: Smr/MutS family protein [Candidatus Thiocaldithrix dubininis]
MSAEDFALFRESMQEVLPLKPTNQAQHDTAKPPPIPFKSIEDEQQVIIDMLSDAYDPIEIQPGDMLSYVQPGIQTRIFKKLKSGHYRVASELDLHGLNALQAKQLLLEFIHHAHPGMGECVRIIHGKGNRSNHRGPVIKTKINHWLRQHNRVLAFHSARPVDGGTGAIYVLLRR